jgi:hypothetical protein
MTIWKYPLEAVERQIIKMPYSAQILTIQTQHNQPCLWVQVDETQRPIERTIAIYRTGHPLPSGAISYIGTFQIDRGTLVFHVFEIL